MKALFDNKIFENYLPVAILIVLTLIYTLFAISHKIGNYGVETDFYGLYAQDAQRILNFEMVQERDHAPGYPLLIAAFTLIFKDFFLAGKILSVLSATGILWVFYCLVKLLFDQQIALLALFLLGLYLIPYSFIVGLDIVFTFFFILSIYLFFKSDGKNNKWLIWSGIVSGIAFMLRYNGILLPIGVFLILILVNFNYEAYRQRIQNFLVYLTPFLFIILPWFIFIQFVEGESSSPGLNAAIAWEFYGPGGEFGGDERKMVESKFSSLSAIVFHDFKRFVLHYIDNIFERFEQFSLKGFSFPAFYFVLPGIIVTLAVSSLRKLTLFIFPVLGFLVLCLVNYLTRYYLFIFPFFVLIIGLFFFSPFPDNGKFKWLSFKYLKYAALGMLVIFVSHQSWYSAKAEIKSEPRELLSIADMLKKQTDRKQSIIARKPHLAYFAGFKHEPFPQVKTIDALVQYAKKNDNKFVFYGSMERKYRPHLECMSHPDSVLSFMNVIYENERNDIFLYTIK